MPGFPPPRTTIDIFDSDLFLNTRNLQKECLKRFFENKTNFLICVLLL